MSNFTCSPLLFAALLGATILNLAGSIAALYWKRRVREWQALTEEALTTSARLVERLLIAEWNSKP
jgi:hypothetical protein